MDLAYTTATVAGGGFGYGASGSKHSFRFWRTMTDGVATYRVSVLPPPRHSVIYVQ